VTGYIIGGGAVALIIAGLIIAMRVYRARAEKYRHHLSDALNDLSTAKLHVLYEQDAHDRTRKVLEFQDEIFRQIEDGELSVDDLNRVRSGMLPEGNGQDGKVPFMGSTTP